MIFHPTLPTLTMIKPCLKAKYWKDKNHSMTEMENTFLTLFMLFKANDHPKKAYNLWDEWETWTFHLSQVSQETLIDNPKTPSSREGFTHGRIRAHSLSLSIFDLYNTDIWIISAKYLPINKQYMNLYHFCKIVYLKGTYEKKTMIQ